MSSFRNIDFHTCAIYGYRNLYFEQFPSIKVNGIDVNKITAHSEHLKTDTCPRIKDIPVIQTNINFGRIT